MNTAMIAEAIGRLTFNAALRRRLVKEIAHRGAKWTGENERHPEQRHPRHAGPETRRAATSTSAAPKDQRAAFIAEAGIGGPVAERRSQRLREGDGRPVEDFHFRLW